MIRSTRTHRPPTDVIELADKIVVMVEIAGMRTEDLNISLHDKRLTISGSRRKPEHHPAAYHQLEIGFGEFKVDLDLPWTIEREAVTATYEDGLLTVELPRKTSRVIPVVDVSGDA
ncbi:MAG: Hsp20/alpha crystallin family protein [Chloroflexi bacterium]|nr:Hsp20/alpha crystallin family protein [Chloroflexota bacterium]MCC6894418.1 Hsp20/alpha crystallin family protein [Anaerolineae bacterium]